jgi:Arc/MetJ family transcription regulator
MKRTNLVLDADTLEEARQALGTKTYSETVNRALSEAIRHHKMEQILPFLGKGLWNGDLTEMRRDAKSPQPPAHPRRKAAAR